ncbi:MAG: DUF4242 domain-containing protein [Thiohalocapsa sp.]|jgi:hypothetical protein|nr:DUF4242 domain-containing protein [Thiohalocapsa sp.]MCF7989211.1 DUF4242 domain-containing protein [Thiohalocapsa sp.]
MPKYIVERELPRACELSEEDLDSMCRRLESTIVQADPGIQWLQSFVADDKIYCMYVAIDEELIRRVSDECGFPTTRISRIDTTLQPTSED